MFLSIQREFQFCLRFLLLNKIWAVKNHSEYSNDSFFYALLFLKVMIK